MYSTAKSRNLLSQWVYYHIIDFTLTSLYMLTRMIYFICHITDSIVMIDSTDSNESTITYKFYCHITDSTDWHQCAIITLMTLLSHHWLYCHITDYCHVTDYNVITQSTVKPLQKTTTHISESTKPQLTLIISNPLIHFNINLLYSQTSNSTFHTPPYSIQSDL